MENNICYIFCAGDLYYDEITIPADTFIIAADGGLEHTELLGIKPDVIMGDFDSAEKPDSDCIVYPTEKDYTDSFLAAKYAYDNGYRTIHMYGCIGGKRLDHTVANIAMLEYFAKLRCDITLHADGQLVQAFCADGDAVSVLFDDAKKGYISLFAVGGNVDGLTVKGLKYELDNYTLTSAFPLGISNEFINSTAEISFNNGTLLIIYNF